MLLKSVVIRDAYDQEMFYPNILKYSAKNNNNNGFSFYVFVLSYVL